MSIVERKDLLVEKAVFVDGLPGCGKTLLSRIVSSFDRVELLSYAYEVEYVCSLSYLNRITTDAAETIVKLNVDQKIYNTMMGRDVNFRPSDLSSVFSDHDPMRYFKRLFSDGDAVIPALVRKENPVLNFAVHNMMPFSEPIWQALGDKCVFIEVVRHPLYMTRQQLLNFENLIGNPRHFSVYFKYGDNHLPFFAKGWEDLYVKSNNPDRVIYFIEKLTEKTDLAMQEFYEKYKANTLVVPFELFVLDPYPWIEKIANAIGINASDSVIKIMKEQNVPRDKVSDGVELPIYRRCGWVPPVRDFTEREELNRRKDEIGAKLGQQAMTVLDKICTEYEKKYWSPEE